MLRGDRQPSAKSFLLAARQRSRRLLVMVRKFSIDRQGEIVFVDKGAMYDGQRGEGKERTAVGRVTDRVVVLVAPIVRVPKTRLPFSLSLSFPLSLLSRSTNDDAAEECQWRRPPPSCWFSYPLPMRKHPLEEHEDKKGYWALPRRGRVQRPIMRPLLALPTRHSPFPAQRSF